MKFQLIRHGLTLDLKNRCFTSPGLWNAIMQMLKGWIPRKSLPAAENSRFSLEWNSRVRVSWRKKKRGLNTWWTQSWHDQWKMSHSKKRSKCKQKKSYLWRSLISLPCFCGASWNDFRIVWYSHNLITKRHIDPCSFDSLLAPPQSTMTFSSFGKPPRWHHHNSLLLRNAARSRKLGNCIFKLLKPQLLFFKPYSLI